MKTQLFLGAVLIQFLAVGQTSIQQPDCTALNELVIAKSIADRLDEAEAAISTAVSNGKYVCGGVVFGNVAVLLSVRGRTRDSEAFAARSVDLLRKHVDLDDPILFRSPGSSEANLEKQNKPLSRCYNSAQSAQSSAGRSTSRVVCCGKNKES